MAGLTVVLRIDCCATRVRGACVVQWFEKEMPGKDPQATLDDLDGDGWNGWRGRAYVYDEYYHATAWVGREAVSFIQGFNSTPAGKAGLPYFLKVRGQKGSTWQRGGD